MYHYGMVPFLGHNATEALAYYQEVREGGGGGRQAVRCSSLRESVGKGGQMFSFIEDEVLDLAASTR